MSSQIRQTIDDWEKTISLHENRLKSYRSYPQTFEMNSLAEKHNEISYTKSIRWLNTTNRIFKRRCHR